MAFSIPVRMLATAAAVAAEIYHEDAADVFDDAKWSRARMIAIAAMRKVFPTASQASIARCFGLIGDSKRIGQLCEKARNAGWWNDDAVEEVYRTVKHLGGYSDDHLPEATREPRVAIDEEKALTFTPRRVTDPRKCIVVPAAARPANVTALLMGDPPPGRREFLEATPHKNFAFVENPSGRDRGRVSK